MKLLCMAASLAACLMALLATQSLHAQTYDQLYSFKGSPDGAFPYSGVIRDSEGNLYGTSPGGGIAFECGKLPCGVVFKLDSAGKETVLYTFCSQSNCSDGYSPSGGLFRDAEGNFFGSTEFGGAYGYGTIFKLSRTGKETVLYSFCSHPTSCLDGAYPNGELIHDAEGNLYGTTHSGGAFNWGTVFKLSKTGKETVLYSFCSAGNCADGSQPNWGVIQDAEGNLYGTTNEGGVEGEFGTVFKLSKTGKESVLHSFTGGVDGGGSLGGLIQDLKGNLYGTSWGGGADGHGNVFKLSRKQNGQWKETVLYSFAKPDGYYPSSGLIQDANRNLYGTTSLGGGTGCGGGGCGVVFKLSSAGKETVLHSFTGTDGDNPGGGLVQDAAGNLYGVAGLGGDLSCADGQGQGCGVVFKLRP